MPSEWPEIVTKLQQKKVDFTETVINDWRKTYTLLPWYQFLIPLITA